MNIKKTSWHARLWKWSFVKSDADLTNNFCSYCRQLLAAIVLFPITGFSLWLDQTCDKSRDIVDRFVKGVLSLAVFSLIYIIGYGIACNVFNQGGHWAWIYALPCAVMVVIGFILGVALVIAIVAATIWVCDKVKDFSNRVKDTAPKENRKKNIVVEFIKAKKNKYCPQINWE